MAKKNFLFVLPLLTLLSVSPSELLKDGPSRSIASVEVEEITGDQKEEQKEEKKFERFKAMISQIDQSNLLVSDSITKESVKEKAVSLKDKIQSESEKFNKQATDKEEIKLQRELVESLVVDAVIFDKEVSVLFDKEEIEEEFKQELLLAGESHKEGLEILIVDLEKNEELLDIEPPIIADADDKVDDQVDDKIDDQEEKEDAPKVVSDDEKVEDKKEEKECLANEQVKVLTSQVEKLMEEQNLILQAMLNLTQVMVNMSQMQSQQPYFPMPQTAYQYHAPMSQGNWVYYPQGFNPQMNQGFYPNQAYGQPQQQYPQPQNNWTLQPSQSFQFSPQAPMPQVGQFGMEQAPMNSFNFSSQPQMMPLIGMN